MSFDPDFSENEKVEFLYTDEVSEDLASDDCTDFEDDEVIDSFSAFDDFDNELSIN